MMAAAKVCLLVCATGAQLYAVIPPNTKPHAKERLKPTGWEIATPWLIILMKSMLCGYVLAEIIFTITHDPTPSPALLAGSLLSIIGALIRSYCYQTLGRFFTFELSIRQDHKLVTSGPYSVVRHPSYAGLTCVCLGVLVCQFHTRSSLVHFSGLFPSSDQGIMWTLACIWVVLSSILYTSLGARIRKEEIMLGEHFGDQWSYYTKKVPYKLVPWLY